MDLQLKYGIELEYALLDRKKPPINGTKYATAETDIASRHHKDGKTWISVSNPRDITTPGGEVNLVPTDDIEGQVQQFKETLAYQPQVEINHRLFLHIHVSSPLFKDINNVLKILKYTQANMDFIADKVYNPVRDPLMTASTWSYMQVNRSRMPKYREESSLKATSLEEFFHIQSVSPRGVCYPTQIRRYAVNLYSLKKHGTIEFRHFFPTLKEDELRDALRYCTKFLEEALGDQNSVESWFVGFDLPKQQPYDHELEQYWQTHNFKSGYGKKLDLGVVNSWDMPEGL